MVMVLIGIMVFQPVLLLVSDVVGTAEAVVKSKLFQRLQSSGVSWRDDGRGLAAFQVRAVMNVADMRKTMEDSGAC